MCTTTKVQTTNISKDTQIEILNNTFLVTGSNEELKKLQQSFFSQRRNECGGRSCFKRQPTRSLRGCHGPYIHRTTETRLTGRVLWFGSGGMSQRQMHWKCIERVTQSTGGIDTQVLNVILCVPFPQHYVLHQRSKTGDFLWSKNNKITRNSANNGFHLGNLFTQYCHK